MSAQLVPTLYSDASVKNPPQDSLDKTKAIRYAARQPILDRGNRVHAYQLLFWNGEDPSAQEGDDGLAFHANSQESQAENAEARCTPVIQPAREPSNHVLLGGSPDSMLERLTSGRPAFVKCTADSLIEGWLGGLPPSLTVLEVTEGAESTPSLVVACRKLKELGFRLALDDFIGLPGSGPLLELADYVKVDVGKLDDALRRQLKETSARLIAKNVETQEEYRTAKAEGFEFFQGFYFCRPEAVKKHTIPSNRLIHLEILDTLQGDPIDLHRLTQLVMCDASLTYGLLRLVNSPVCAMRQEVTSIQSALMLLGMETSRRIAILAIAGEFNTDQPSELLRMAFERGRFCEQAAGLLGLVPSEQYLIGMVSMFPAMLRISMDELIRLLPLREEARDALLGKGNREGVLLDLLVHQENGDWKACEMLIRSNGLRFYEILRLRTDAGAWADATLEAAS